MNLNCSLETCGDWHQSAIQLEKPTMRDTCESIFRYYGIEKDISIPEHEGKFCVANHIRALLDLLETGMLTIAQGMRDELIDEKKLAESFLKMLGRLSHDNQGSEKNRTGF